MIKSRFSHLKLTALIAVFDISRRRLFQLTLIGAALLTGRAATAQPLKGPCDATIKVDSVKYLGKSSGDDQFEVKWSTSAASSCVKFGAAGGDCLRPNRIRF